MFVRKKRNKSGTISIIVVDKSRGKYRDIKHLGTVSTEDEAVELVRQAKSWIKHYGGQQTIDFDGVQKKESDIDELLQNISQVLMDGPRQILDRYMIASVSTESMTRYSGIL